MLNSTCEVVELASAASRRKKTLHSVGGNPCHRRPPSCSRSVSRYSVAMRENNIWRGLNSRLWDGHTKHGRIKIQTLWNYKMSPADILNSFVLSVRVVLGVPCVVFKVNVWAIILKQLNILTKVDNVKCKT